MNELHLGDKIVLLPFPTYKKGLFQTEWKGWIVGGKALENIPQEPFAAKNGTLLKWLKSQVASQQDWDVKEEGISFKIVRKGVE